MSKLDAFLNAARTAPQLMGVLNVTPDSFSDGGQYNSLDAALAQAQALSEAGASCIDVGGESTRPDADPVSAEDELQRVAPILQALSQTDALISIDTYKSSVAEAAVRAGAELINDVWGMTRSPDIADVAAAHDAGVVITYNRGAADRSIDIVADMQAFFDRQISHAEAAGVSRERILLDPGIGFGKTWQQNYQVMAAIDKLHAYGCLLLIGVSRKSFIGHLTGAPVNARLPGTLAAGLMSLEAGAQILRVHDVAEHTQAIDVWSACKTGETG